MRIRELGRVSGRMLLFGAPYANLFAMEALFEAMVDLRVSRRAMLCTGDVMGIGAAPAATYEMLREAGVPIVKGDCDAHVAWSGTDVCQGLDPGPQGAKRTEAWHAHAMTEVPKPVRERLALLPDHIRFQHGQRRYVAIHGGAQRRTALLWRTLGDEVFRAEIEALRSQHGNFDGVICGHSGLPFERQIDGVRWINVGAAGLPANDGTQSTRFVTLETNGQAITHRLAYDHHAARKSMIDAGLVQGHHDTILTGVWPAQLKLPPALRYDHAVPGADSVQESTPGDDAQARSA